DPEFQEQLDEAAWPAKREKLNQLFKTRTRQQWCDIMEGTDVCFAPVLDLNEAPSHPHNIDRKTFVELDGVVQPAPAPRFSRTQGEIQGPAAMPGEHTREVLSAWNFSDQEISELQAAGAI
ncbi:MAG: carnitine dehydratase, partial [Gammaproteobacteria bacterium]|nr:carnitine dehydratase [Gammaproteobacteria bacterium]